MRDRDLVDLQAGDIGEFRGVAGEHGEFVRECGGGDERFECSRPGGAPGCSQAGPVRRLGWTRWDGGHGVVNSDGGRKKQSPRTHPDLIALQSMITMLNRCKEESWRALPSATSTTT